MQAELLCLRLEGCWLLEVGVAVAISESETARELAAPVDSLPPAAPARLWDSAAPTVGCRMSVRAGVSFLRTCCCSVHYVSTVLSILCCHFNRQISWEAETAAGTFSQLRGRSPRPASPPCVVLLRLLRSRQNAAAWFPCAQGDGLSGFSSSSDEDTALLD